MLRRVAVAIFTLMLVLPLSVVGQKGHWSSVQRIDLRRPLKLEKYAIKTEGGFHALILALGKVRLYVSPKEIDGCSAQQ